MCGYDTAPLAVYVDVTSMQTSMELSLPYIEVILFCIAPCVVVAYYRDTMTRVMSLPIKTVMEYKAHDASLR